MINETAYKQKLNANKELTVKPKTNSGNWSLQDLLQKEISLFPSSFQDKHKASFYGELAILLQSGVDLVEALDIISQQYKQKQKKQILEQIKKKVIAGESLSQAMRETKQFSDYELFSIQIGEESGQLISILSELKDFYTKRIQQRRKIISALSYPFVVTIIAVVAVLFMLRFLVPMFSSVYKQFGGDLPKITQFVLALSTGLQKNSWLIITLIGILIAAYFLAKNTIPFRKASDFVLFNSPLFGSIFQKIYLSRFARSMSLLLGSDVPLVSALDFSQKMIGRYTIQQFLEQSKDDIYHGKSLHSSLQQFSLFPPKFISMVKVGESTNQLPFLFDQLSEQYTNEVEHQTNLINSILEPMLILFLGMVVGFILVALYLPIFELSTNFGI